MSGGAPTGPHPLSSRRGDDQQRAVGLHVGGGSLTGEGQATRPQRPEKITPREGHAHAHQRRVVAAQSRLTLIDKEKRRRSRAREGGAPRGPRPRTSRSAAARQRPRQGHANSHREGGTIISALSGTPRERWSPNSATPTHIVKERRRRSRAQEGHAPRGLRPHTSRSSRRSPEAVT